MKHDLGNGWTFEFSPLGAYAYLRNPNGDMIILSAGQLSRLAEILATSPYQVDPTPE